MNIYKSLRDSLYAACKAFSTDQSLEATIYNFDAFQESSKLPDGNLIGLHGFNLDTNDELVTVRVNIGLSITNDKSNEILDATCGDLLVYFGPKTTHPLYDADTRLAVGEMTVGPNVSLSPVYQAQQRPLKFLNLTVFSSKAVFQ